MTITYTKKVIAKDFTNLLFFLKNYIYLHLKKLSIKKYYARQ